MSSTGVFSYQRGKNILWKTLEPIENELIMSPSMIINKQGGNELVHLDANPTVRMINELFFFILPYTCIITFYITFGWIYSIQ